MGSQDDCVKISFIGWRPTKHPNWCFAELHMDPKGKEGKQAVGEHGGRSDACRELERVVQ